ncbi:hypothetical protein [Fontibacillus sp. BL9]|uniref:hypothetical protein n=1 Tax=Fontibacillus sp. BL9 TaxID=3389971 RepID=UPI00397B9EA5
MRIATPWKTEELGGAWGIRRGLRSTAGAGESVTPASMEISNEDSLLSVTSNT